MPQEALAGTGPSPRYPKKRVPGAPDGDVPGSCLRKRKGGFASLLVFPLPPAGTRNKMEVLALPITEGKKNHEATGSLIVAEGNNS